MKRQIYNILIFTALLFVTDTVTAQKYAENSVLAEGLIYKVGVVSDGIYRISYNDLVSWGISPSSINPKKISVFGNESGMLPEANAAENYDDLTEMRIIVMGEEDGTFDVNDEILFYGQSQVTWKLESGKYLHQINHYSDTSYYFLKLDNQYDGKRMTKLTQAEGSELVVVDKFLDRKYHEIDKENYYKRGRRWYGETISGQTQKSMTFLFSFANAEVGSDGFVNFGFIGASKNENIKVRFSVDGVQVMDDVLVQKVGDLLFGRENEENASFTVNADDIEVSVEIVANNSSSFVGLDYIDVNVWRRLIYNDEQLQFNLTPTSGHGVLNTMEIENTYDDMILLDVTNPLSPNCLDYNIENQIIRYIAHPTVQSCVLARPNDCLSVASAKMIENQNLHGNYENDYAEMIIVTDKIFAQQAEEIKAIHANVDDMLSVIAFVDEIYNEFSSGSQDVTAIRNFIRMVYGRSENLKYVMLLGRGTCDYKNILGYSNNFVPPYESMNVTSEIESYVSDDYFGLMNLNEGQQLVGKMDLGVGRIPVVDADEAEDVVNKIRRYIDASTSMKNWRNNLILIADDQKSYANNCEAIDKIVDTLEPSVNVSKIYTDAYVRQKKSDGSYCYPDATDAIMKGFSRGALIVTYIGHGGVKGLSNSNLLKIDNIVNFENYDRLPFMATATCEFSAFDDPSFVSAGERVFKMNNGGAIAMFTTTRPTYSGTNLTIMKNLHRNIFTGDNLRVKTIGEIIMETKKNNSSNSSNYVSYVLFGDPALRLSYPQNTAIITSINELDAKKDYHVEALRTMNVDGRVLGADGCVDSLFNGVVWVKMFDNESMFSTLNNAGTSTNSSINFKYHSDVLFEGKASVVNGCFSIIYNIPRTVNYQKGKARISLYAVDTVREIDANGYLTNIRVIGQADVAVDNQGPEIKLMWNGQPECANNVSQNGVLTAEIYDPQGIYHYDNVIGRNMVLTHNSFSNSEFRNVNMYFEPAVDDFTKGILRMEFNRLESGEHEFALSAWDTHDNNSVASIKINVAEMYENLTLVNVVNAPNPFSDYTVFKFDCKKQDVTFDMTITIRDVMGRVVNILKYNMLTCYDAEVAWNGCDAAGNHLLPGTYVYSVFVKDSTGEMYVTNQKMLVTR